MKKILILLIFTIGLFTFGYCAMQDNPPGTQTEVVQPQYMQLAMNSDAQAVVNDPGSQTENVQSDTPVQNDVINAVDETALPPADTPFNILGFLKNYAAELTFALMGFAKVVVNLTPTKKDDNVFLIFDKFINWFIPNNKVGGGTFR